MSGNETTCTSVSVYRYEGTDGIRLLVLQSVCTGIEVWE